MTEEKNGEVLDEIVARIVRLVANVRKRQDRITQSHGVTMLQYQAIHALRAAGPINITQLAERLHLNQSTVSSLADRMEKAGLVRRIQSSTDRRSVKLRLTEKADDVAESFPVSPLDFFKLLLQDLSREERTQLAQILARVEGSIEKRFAAFDATRAEKPASKKQGTG
ncbi:MAG: MarR family transcriptional regulator [Bdellovibrionota bacterium]